VRTGLVKSRQKREKKKKKKKKKKVHSFDHSSLFALREGKPADAVARDIRRDG